MNSFDATNSILSLETKTILWNMLFMRFSGADTMQFKVNKLYCTNAKPSAKKKVNKEFWELFKSDGQ